MRAAEAARKLEEKMEKKRAQRLANKPEIVDY
jgi:hypothetical protein